LTDPDAVGHLIQHRFTLSGVSVRCELRRPAGPDSGPAGVPRTHVHAAERSSFGVAWWRNRAVVTARRTPARPA
jgi:hypothetical protein